MREIALALAVVGLMAACTGATEVEVPAAIPTYAPVIPDFDHAADELFAAAKCMDRSIKQLEVPDYMEAAEQMWAAATHIETAAAITVSVSGISTPLTLASEELSRAASLVEYGLLDQAAPYLLRVRDYMDQADAAINAFEA